MTDVPDLSRPSVVQLDGRESYAFARGLDKSLVLSLATCQWIRDRHNVLITGPTGIGKPCS